jgi:hypothetical protein
MIKLHVQATKPAKEKPLTGWAKTSAEDGVVVKPNK